MDRLGVFVSDTVEPREIVDMVDRWIDGEISSALRWDNKELLDEDGAYTLHRLAAGIYAAGWTGGSSATQERLWAQRRRDRKATEGDRAS